MCCTLAGRGCQGSTTGDTRTWAECAEEVA